MNKVSFWSILVYVGLLMGLAVYGFVKSGSLASLISGLVFGLSLGISGALIMAGFRTAFHASIVILTMITIVFSYRFAISFKLIPGGMALLSLSLLFFLIYQFRKNALPERSNRYFCIKHRCILPDLSQIGA